VEIKKNTHPKFIDAMDQIVDAIKHERLPNKSSFVIVGRGIHIAFFYYFSDEEDLNRKNIIHHSQSFMLVVSTNIKERRGRV
jgi:hypothetical protein